MAIAGGLAAWTVAAASGLQPLQLALGATAVVLVAAGCAVSRSGPVYCALALLGMAYTLRLLIGSAPLDFTAPLFGTGLLLCAEAAAAARPAGRRVHVETAVLRSRCVVLLLVIIIGDAIGAAALAAATVGGGGSALVTVLGATAATGAVLLVAWQGRPRGVRP